MFLADSFRAVLRAIEGAPGSPLWTLALKGKLAAEIAAHPAYFAHVVLPAAKTAVVQCGAPLLPMIPPEQTKQNAVHRMFWGLFFENWLPEGGSSVFLSDLASRGPGNRRKKLFAAAMTPDRYATSYKPKVDAFHTRIFDSGNRGQPFMGVYVDAFIDLYWDLHLGVAPAAIPAEVRDLQRSFVAVFSDPDPFSPSFFEHYMNVRQKRPALMAWVQRCIADLPTRPGGEHSFVHAWLAASADEACFPKDAVAFECYSDMLAMSQWPQTAYLMARALSIEPAWQDLLDAAGRDPVQLRPLVLEMFRMLCPNANSFSPLGHKGVIADAFGLEIINAVPHHQACRDPRLWTDPERLDPGRFVGVPTSDTVDQAHVRAAGFAAAPFAPVPVAIAGRPGLEMTNSAWGTVYGVLDGRPMPVCDHAGFAPFGYGYRRCPGEPLTLAVFADFLAELTSRNLVFFKLNLPSPAMVVIGPVGPEPDDFAFNRRVIVPPARPATAEPIHV